MRDRVLNLLDKTTIVHALRLAARERHSYSKVMLQCAGSGGNAMLLPEHAKLLAAEHRRDAKDIEAQLDLIEKGGEILLEARDE